MTPAPYTGWMQAMRAITYKPMKIDENKGSLMGHTKKQYLKKELTKPILILPNLSLPNLT